MTTDDSLAARAEEICAHLLIFPHLKRSRYRDLLLDEELREEVQRRLDGVGMRLAESFYSDHFAVRPKESIECDIRFDWATNKRLPKGAVALIVVLWAKLVLPRRVARDQRVDPDDDNLALFPDQRPPKDYVVKVPKEALLAEYSPRFGRSNVLRYLGQLKRLGFIREDRSNRIHEGPLLDLLVDGQRLASEIQSGVLKDMLDVSFEEIQRRHAPELELTSEDAPDGDEPDPDLDPDEEEDE